MLWFIGGVIFLFGLTIGSFLNAFIYRLELQEGLVRSPSSHKPSVLQGRSFCPHCGRQLSWYDLVPLLSFVLLLGQCRYCKEKIALQYPFVELATGLLFVATFSLLVDNLVKLSYPQALEVLYLWALVSTLLVVFVYDLKHYLIPDNVLFLAVGLTLLWRAFEQFEFGILSLFRISDFGFWISLPFAQSITAGISAGLFFFVIYVLSKGRAMGFGDVKLALFMGLFLSWPGILVALAIAFALGALVGIGLIAAKKKTMRSEVPFGPFLVLGTLAALFWGEAIISFYWYD